jgi:DNA polymerase III subunit epsilon
MAGWHEGLMCAFDTESTDSDPTTARIVTACVSWVDGSGKSKPVTRTWLADPGVPSKPEALRVHGISDERARKEGASPVIVLAEITEELMRAAAEGIPVVAFNIPFDFTLTDRETRRNGLEPFGPQFEAANGHCIDSHVLDKHLSYRKGKRNLGSTAEHYGVKAGTAHDAAGDAITAARVAWAIAAKYPKIAEMSLDALFALQVLAKAEQAKSLAKYFAEIGKPQPVDGSWPLKPWTGEDS